MKTCTIIVAAGSGTRFGGPKQIQLLGDSRVIDRSCLAASTSTDSVVISTTSDLVSDFEATLADHIVVEGGSTRSASVRAALAQVADDIDIIVIHDAARPLATTELFAKVMQGVVDGADAVVPGISVVDTVYRVANQQVEIVDRSDLTAVQTPQAFRASVLREAHSSQNDATDDATLVERIGGKVVVVAGETFNLKITTRLDLVVARALAAEL